MVESEGDDAGEESQESSAKEILDSCSDPALYQLVRVEGNGRLVPATDDEVMEVENFLAVEDAELSTKQFHPAEIFSSKTCDTEFSEGLSHSDITEDSSGKLNAKLEYIEEMLRKVKEEEQTRLSYETRHYSHWSASVDGQSSDHLYDLLACNTYHKLGNGSQEISYPLGTERSHAAKSCKGETSSQPANKSASIQSLASDPSASSNINFSALSGEICVDRLTVRELQEVFRVVFGRQTNVKDKTWLKRQITLKLANFSNNDPNDLMQEKNLSDVVETESTELKSDPLQTSQVGCQDSPSSLCKKVEKVEDLQMSSSKRSREPISECDLNTESQPFRRKVANCSNNGTDALMHEKNLSCVVENTKSKSGPSQTSQATCQGSPPCPSVKIEDLLVSSYKRSRKPISECDLNNENLSSKQTAGKRVRKPNRRYIEEHIKVDTKECIGSLSSVYPPSRFRSVHNIVSRNTVFATSHDSSGGRGIQDPYISQVRRIPRKKLMALTKLNPNGITSELVQRTLCHHFREQNDGGDMLKSAAIGLKRNISCMNHERRIAENSGVEEQTSEEHEKGYISDDNSDDVNGFQLPTTAKRNHHRAWTLREVVKLVEGVAKYGAGRWSEIKRLVFASYTYRTSVDLKDKWRNLLKASFTQGLMDKEAREDKKHASISIPASILLRVRELAEMQSSADDALGTRKLVGINQIFEREKPSGFL